MDDWRWVARRYLATSFIFDLGTSIPVSYIELAANAACSLVGGVHTQTHTDTDRNTNASLYNYVRASERPQPQPISLQI